MEIKYKVNKCAIGGPKAGEKREKDTTDEIIAGKILKTDCFENESYQITISTTLIKFRLNRCKNKTDKQTNKTLLDASSSNC